MEFFKEALELKDFMIKVRRDLHMHPELGYELQYTNEVVTKYLNEWGIEYYNCAKTGICAIITGKGEKTIAIRGDMDALPLTEKNSCEYSSKCEGKMHACGHDAHTAILLGAAKILKDNAHNLNGNVKLLFEPAEETDGGARIMIDEGCLENPKVDAIIGLHVDEELETGKIRVKKGVVNAASNPFKVKIQGSGGHGASPHTAVDPIVASCNIINSLQSIVSRELPPVDPGVITIGSIHGGSAANIIPESVEFEGIIRTMKNEHREYAKKRLVEITEGIAKSMRCEAQVEIIESYPCLYNDDIMVELFLNSAKKAISDENVKIKENPNMGVESFAYFAQKCPSVFYYLGCRNEEKGIVNAAHNPFFDIDEECMVTGAAVHCAAVFDFLNN